MTLSLCTTSSRYEFWRGLEREGGGKREEEQESALRLILSCFLSLDAVQQDHHSSDVYQVRLSSSVQCHHLGKTGVCVCNCVYASLNRKINTLYMNTQVLARV